jgi:ribosomal protein S18 acetylase RimI-like enzyme
LTIKIRDAQFSDYEPILALYTEELAYHVELVPEIFQMAEPVMTKEWYKQQLDNAAVMLTIAEVDEQIVGAIQVMLHNSPNDPIFKKRKYAHIEDIVVAGNYRKQGIGRILMESARKWAKANGTSALELWVWRGNENAIGFYQKLGYRIVRHSLQLKLE